jgi:hypothetical protein
VKLETEKLEENFSERCFLKVIVLTPRVVSVNKNGAYPPVFEPIKAECIGKKDVLTQKMFIDRLYWDSSLISEGVKGKKLPILIIEHGFCARTVKA